MPSTSLRFWFTNLFLIPVLCAAEPSPLLEELVVSATRIDTVREQLAQAINTVSSDDLRLIAHSHINESFFGIPGGWISRGNGQEHLTALRSPVLTGAGACGAFLMTEDLVPLRAAGFCNVNQLFDANTEQADRLEVIRGPGSAIYGSNAMHGVINVILPQANREDPTSVGIEAGPHGYVRAQLHASGALDNHDLAVLANLTHDGGYKKESGFDQAKLSLRHAYQGDHLQIDSALSAVRLDQDTAGFIVGNEAYKDNARRKENPNPEAYRDVRALRAWTRLNLHHNNWQYLLRPYFRWNEMEFLQHFLPWQSVEENGHWSVGMQFSAHRSIESHHISLVAGMDLEYTEGWLKETQPAPFSASIPVGKHYDYAINSAVAAPFVQLQWQAFERTRIEASVRFEHNAYDYDNRLTDGSACGDDVSNCRFFRPDDGSDDYSDLSPRLALFQQINPDNSAWLSAARGFRAPQATELYRLQNNQAGTELDSERLDSLELGYRRRFGSGVFEMVAFVMTKRDFIFQDSNRQNVTGGKSSHRGIELMLRWPITETLRLDASGTWAKHEYGNNVDIAAGPVDGRDIDTAPRTLGRVALNWIFRADSLAQLELVHLGKYELNPLGTSQYDGHELLNLRAKFQLSARWAVSARLTNLTDIEYAERADFGFGNQRYFVGEPRSLYVGIDASW